MGLASFPSHYIALAEHGREVSLPVAQEHYFTAALQLAYQTLEQGWSEQLSRAAFEAVISRSAEMAAANQLLSQGLSFAEATLQPLRVSSLQRGGSQWKLTPPSSGQFPASRKLQLMSNVERPLSAATTDCSWPIADLKRVSAT